jgi:hypothetical protein
MLTIKRQNKNIGQKIGRGLFFTSLIFSLFVFFSCMTSSGLTGLDETEGKSKSEAAQKARDAANKGFMDEMGEGIGIADIPESLPGRTVKPSQFDEPEIVITQNINTSTKQPDWVRNAQKTFPSSRYLSAVGSGKSTGEAENAAIASIARIIKQNVSSTLVTTEKDAVSSTGASSNQSTVDEIIETYAVVDALVGVKIAEFWWDKNDIVYALAYVDKQEAAQYYLRKMNENENEIMEKISVAKNSLGQFSSFSLALQALSLAEENEQYIDILYAMDAKTAQSNTFRYGSIVSVKEFSYAVAEAIAIDISVVGDDDGRIGLALSTMLAKYGFKTYIGTSNANYLLDAAVSFVDVPSERNVYVRYIFSANLVDKKTTKILLPYSDNKREGHVHEAGAKERAIQSLVTTIQDEYASFFVDFIRR